MTTSSLDGASIDGHEYRVVVDFARHTPWLHSALELYTTVGLGVLVGLLVFAWWRARRRSDRGAMAAVGWTGVGTVVCVLAALALKQMFAEVRPCLVMKVATVQACPGRTDYSFPSNHMTIAVALAVGIWLADRRLGVLAAVLALVEGFSRVYLGQHYPHDVLAGLVLSAVIVFGGWWLLRRPLTALADRLVRTPLRPLLTAET